MAQLVCPCAEWDLIQASFMSLKDAWITYERVRLRVS